MAGAKLARFWRVTTESDFDYAEGSFPFAVAAPAGVVDRLRSQGVLALGLGLLTYALLRAARPGSDL